VTYNYSSSAAVTHGPAQAITSAYRDILTHLKRHRKRPTVNLRY